MNHLFANEVLDKIVAHFTDDDFPSLNMDDDAWDMVLEEQFNTTEENYEWSDYCTDYDYVLYEVHTFSVDSGAEIEYWNYNKVINLYMYIVAKEIIADCKDQIIEKWQDVNQDEVEVEISQ